MIMPSKDTLYNGRKGIGFENPSYFEKAKDLRPSLYDEKVIGLRYTLMFLTYSDEALKIEKFKRTRENKIEFAYDYGNLNASYVNEKIASRGWSFAYAVPSQMTYLVASLAPNSERSCVMQGASCTQRRVFMVSFVFSIPFILSWGVSISLDSFLPSILLLVVIFVTVVIVVVILIFVAVVIVAVVIVVTIIGVVIVVTIIGVVIVVIVGVFTMVAACASRVAATLSAISCRMAARVMAGVSDVDVLLGAILST
nr:hypothetical protein [Tanacetum cinerariifolium]